MPKKVVRKRRNRVVVSPEQRFHMVEDAAFFRAEKQRGKYGAAGDQDRCRCEAEAAIDAILKRRHAG